jgi:hypothetical protein
MKFLLNQTILSIVSVIILYFLFDSSKFLPYLEDGSFNWKNILVLIFFFGILVISLVSVIMYLIFRYVLKKENLKYVIFQSLKISLFLYIGLITIFFLNFFHILNIYYGIGILILVLIALLVI